MNVGLPRQFQPLFPSTEVTKLEPQRDKKYIIQELLKNSTLEGWKWMFKNYSNQDLVNVIKNSRSLTGKDVSLWMKYFNIPANEIRCLQTKSQNIPRTYWLE